MNFVQILAGDFTCGDSVQVPGRIINIVSTIILLIKFAVPILLIIFGMLDLGKAVMASKEDEIKKGQQMFIKRLVTAVLVFLVIVVVQLLVNLAAKDDESADGGSIWTCVNAFIKGVDCSSGVCTVNK